MITELLKYVKKHTIAVVTRPRARPTVEYALGIASIPAPTAVTAILATAPLYVQFPRAGEQHSTSLEGSTGVSAE